MALDTPTASTSSKRAREPSPSAANKATAYDPTAFYPQAGPASAKKKSKHGEDPEEKRAKMYKKGELRMLISPRCARCSRVMATRKGKD